MKWKRKLFIIGILIALIGFSFIPLFPDPYHEKEEGVCFWEWLWREIHELLHGEKEVEDKEEVCD